MQKEDIGLSTQKTSSLKRVISILGSLLTLLSLVFLVVKLVNNVQSASSVELGINSVITVICGICLFVFMYVLLVHAWMILLRGGNYELLFSNGYIIMGKSQISKYFPGNVLQYIQRVNLGLKYGISSESCILSLGVETVVLAVTALSISATGFFLSDMKLSLLKNIIPSGNYILLFWIAVVVVLIGVTAVLLSKQIRGWILPRLAYLHPKRISLVALLYAIFFLSTGFVIQALLESLWTFPVQLHWYDFSWGFTLAWLLGFIVPGAPGGIGIREAVFVTLFGKEIGEGVAVGLAVVLRIITSLSDVITFSIASLLSLKKQR